MTRSSLRSFPRSSLLAVIGVLTAVVVGAASQPGLAVSAPSISVTASSSTEVGLSIFAVSNLSGGENPTGTITFTLYAPADTGCSSPIFTSQIPVAGNGPYTSQSFLTSDAGTYRWRASYSGDANNTATATACGDPASLVIVGKASTVLTTRASGPITLGGQIHDTAFLSGGLAPTGTITFFVYGPTDTFCSAPALDTSTATVNGNGTYQSEPFTPDTPGVYKWRATYSGDDDNLGVSITPCLDPLETSTVNPGTTTTSTSTTSTSTTSTSTTSTSSTSTTSTSVVPTSTTSTSTSVVPTTSTTATTSTTSTTTPTTTSSTSTSTTLVPTSTTSSSSTTTTSVGPTTTSSTSTTLTPTSTSTTSVGQTTTTSSTSTTLAPTSTSSPTTSTSSTTVATTTTTTSVPVATGTTVATGSPAISVSPNPVTAGQNAIVTGSGFPAGTAGSVTMFSTPVVLGEFTVNAAGTFSIVVIIPVDTAPGVHRLVVTGAAGAQLAETTVTVLAPSLSQSVVLPPGQSVVLANATPVVGVLTRTGADIAEPAQVALGLLLVGAAMLALSRRRPVDATAGEGPDLHVRSRRRRRHPWD